jgi:hypothetical protein
MELKNQVVVEEKPFYQSASFRGVAVAAIPVIIRILRLLGVPVPDLPAEDIVNLFIQVVGGAYSLYGIFRRKDIKIL